MYMNKTKRALIMLLALALIISLSACSMNEVGKYKIASRLKEQSFCIGFRQGDKVSVPVLAALSELQASGKISELSIRWFGEDISKLKGDNTALDVLAQPLEPRVLIVGCDGSRLPFSGEDEDGVMTGFDPELAKEVCALLGWQIRFIPIDVSQAQVELNSGNVDCVWGGFAYDEGYNKIDLSPVYMENTVILASLSGSKLSSTGGLSGKTLTLGENCYHNAVMEENSALTNRPAIINRVPGGTVACIEALNSGGCDAIITDLYALFYYR